MKEKTLLALSIANLLIAHGTIVYAQEEPTSMMSLVEEIQQCKELPPIYKAADLLLLAESYISGDGTPVIADRFKNPASFYKLNARKDRLDEVVRSMMFRLAQLVPSMNLSQATTGKTTRKVSVTPERVALAKSALAAAQAQINSVYNHDTLLNYYFVAARLFYASGDDRKALQCESIVNNGLFRSEFVKELYDEPAAMCCLVLDAQSFGKIPLEIPDTMPEVKACAVTGYSENDFRECEKLKLRAISIVDRLSPEDHVRRKAHRDLALWYLKLDKPKLAEKQKEVLFKLLGARNEDFLYPTSSSCGHYSWWQPGKAKPSRSCGMG